MKKILTFSFLFFSLCTMAQTSLWGTTQEGGSGGIGSVYYTTPGNTSPQVAHSFSSEVPGKKPNAGMIEPVPGFLYGMCSEGGIFNKGVIYKYEISSGVYTKIHDFDGANGEKPLGGLTLASNGLVYGMTSLGGANGGGVIFALDPSVDTLGVIYDFSFSGGIEPQGRLLESTPGIMFGLTRSGGTLDFGVLFKFELSNNTYTKMVEFLGSTNGKNPRGSLVIGPGGRMYGTCEAGGSFNFGTLFYYQDPNPAVDVVKNFDNASGINPIGDLCYSASNNILLGTCSTGGAYSLGTMFKLTPGLTFTKTFDFDGLNNGSNPKSGLVVFSNNLLLGNTYSGGPSGYGTSYTVDTAGANFQVQSIFDYFGNGAQPNASFFLASDGKAYLPTYSGGELGVGFISRTDVNAGNLSGIFPFNGSGINGGFPLAKLVRASNGLLYGGTSSGGANNSGIVFSIDPANNQFTKVCDLTASIGTDIRGKLVQANGQKLYALCYDGGQFNFGSIIEIDISSPPPVVPQLKVSFSSALGTYPLGGLTLASNGKLYGTTNNGGTNGNGVLFEYNPQTNVYLIRKQLQTGTTGGQNIGHLVELPDGRLIGLHASGTSGYNGVLFSYNPLDSSYAVLGNFSPAEGSIPQGSPVYVPSTGKVYGLCFNGGSNNKGSIWSHTLVPGLPTAEYSFNGTLGEFPEGELTLTSSGKLYGTTTSGGTNGLGVAFEFNPSNSSYAVTYSFDGLNGANPNSALLALDCNNLTLGSVQTEELVCLGDTASFDAAFTGGSSYQWYKNGIAIPGATQANYTPAAGAVPADNGIYHVCSFDACGYTVNPPIQHEVLSKPDPLIDHNGPLIFCQGQNTFSFYHVANTAGQTYQWLRDGSVIPGATDFEYIPLISGIYTLLVENQAGCDSLSQPLTFTSVDSIPGISVSLSSNVEFICDTSFVTFTASATNTGGNSFFSFFKNGVLQSASYNTSTTILCASGDLIQVMMTPDTCAYNDSIFSNSISIIDTCISLGLSCSVNTTNICSGANLTVNWNALSAPSITNQYFVELSDLSGSFLNPTSIGVINSNALSGSIICNLPASLPSGSGYRVRVNSNAPAETGPDNGVNIAIVSNNFNLSFTANPSTITNSNRTTTFSNTTPGSGSFNFTWHFGDGVFEANNGLVVSHVYPNNGIFYPSLIAVSSAGCSDTLFSTANQIIVNVPGFPPCGFQATTSPTGSVNGCQGGTIELSYNGNCTSCTYQWNRNGVPLSGGNNQVFNAQIAGFYSMKIIDSAGCVANTPPVNISFGQPASPPPFITATGSLGQCAGGVNATLTANGSYSSYVWNNGATGNNINITQGGSYVVFGQGSAGCDGTSQPFNVIASNIQPIEICMVSATEDSQDNEIIWNGPVGVTNINRFIIYREDLLQTDVYVEIGGVAYADSSSFIDTSANPNARAYRYKLAIEDDCGGITLSSTPVKSMFLVTQPYLGAKRLLSWNDYEGQSQSISKYYIYSGPNQQNLSLIDSVINGNNSTYIDLQPIAGPATIYRVEAGLSSTCNVVDRAPRTRNKSNSAGNLAVMGEIQISESRGFEFAIMPNPARDEVMVSFESPYYGSISIMDIRGSLMLDNKMSGEKFKRFSLNELPPGMYIIRISGDSGSVTKKLIKQ